MEKCFLYFWLITFEARELRKTCRSQRYAPTHKIWWRSEIIKEVKREENRYFPPFEFIDFADNLKTVFFIGHFARNYSKEKSFQLNIPFKINHKVNRMVIIEYYLTLSAILKAICKWNDCGVFLESCQIHTKSVVFQNNKLKMSENINFFIFDPLNPFALMTSDRGNRRKTNSIWCLAVAKGLMISDMHRILWVGASRWDLQENSRFFLRNSFYFTNLTSCLSCSV